MKKFLPSLSALFVVILSTQLTAAQFADSMGMNWNNAGSSLASTMVWNSIFMRIPGAEKAKTTSGSTRSASQSSPTTRPTQPPTQTDPNVVKFRPTGTYIKTSDLAASLATTPAELQQYQTLMNAVLDAFGQKAKQAGFPNDVAAALAFFLGENVRIYRGAPDFSDQQYIDLRNAIADALVTSGGINTLTDRQKQEMYETLVAYTGMTQYGYEQGIQAQNDAIVHGYRKVAGQNLQSVTKTSPDNINFDPNGLSAQPPAALATGNTIDIYQIRHDYTENDVRADQIYKGKRFIFTGTVIDVSGTHYKITGKDETGRDTFSDMGPSARLHNAQGTVVGSEVFAFFRNKNDLARLRAGQVVIFEATVDGRTDGTPTNIIVTDAVLR